MPCATFPWHSHRTSSPDILSPTVATGNKSVPKPIMNIYLGEYPFRTTKFPTICTAILAWYFPLLHMLHFYSTFSLLHMLHFYSTALRSTLCPHSFSSITCSLRQRKISITSGNSRTTFGAPCIVRHCTAPSSPERQYGPAVCSWQ